MMNLKTFFRMGLILTLLAWALVACNIQSASDETAIQIHNPAKFGAEIQTAKAILTVGTQNITLFEGSKVHPNFAGPWSVVLPETQIESMSLHIAGYDANNTQRLDVRIIYRVVGSKLVPDTTVQFYLNTASVSLNSSTYTLSYLALPTSIAPAISLSNPAIASLEGAKTIRLLGTGVVQVFLSTPDLKITDTLTLTISSDPDTTKPDTVEPEPTKPSTPDSIRISKDSLSLFRGIDEYPISWITYPASFQNQVTCMSTNPTSVSMKSNSLIAPVAVGESHIVCSITKSNLSDTLVVLIKDIANPTTPLDSIRLSLDSLTLYTDKPGIPLTYTVYPTTQQIETIWSVAPAIATVNASGFVAPRTTGTGWVLLIGVGSQIVKDSLYLTVLDTTTKPVQWKKDTLFAQIAEGQTLTMRLTDSIINPSSAAVEFLKPGANTRFALTATTLGFTAGANDSGDHFQAITLLQGGRIASVVVHIRVLPVYFTLEATATQGSVTVIPAKPKYRLGERVTLLPVAATGFVFSGWTGDATGSANPLEVLMNKNHSVTAVFTSGTTSACGEVASGASLNAAILQGYQSSARTVTLCLVPSGRFDQGTIQALGKVNIILTR
jgi:uncharacterized repeat protein (TIGR02543 family)